MAKRQLTDAELLAAWRWETARGQALSRWGRTDLAHAAYARADDHLAELQRIGIGLQQEGP